MTDDIEPDVPKKSRILRLIKWGCGFAFLLPLLIFGWRVVSPFPRVQPSPEVTHVTGPLDDEGYVDFAAAINEHYGRGVDPEENACVALAEILGPDLEDASDEWLAEFWRLLGMEPLPPGAESFVPFNKFAANAIPERVARRELEAELTSVPWTADEFPQGAAWLTAMEDKLDAVHQAVERPKYFSPVVRLGAQPLAGARIPHVQGYRSLALGLSARAMLRIGEGDVEGAKADILAMHRLGRQCARGPIHIEQLVGVSCDALAHYAAVPWLIADGVTASMIADLRQDVRELSPFPPFWENVDVAERLFLLDSIQQIARGRFDKEESESMAFPAIADWNVVCRHANAHVDELVAILKIEDLETRTRRSDELYADLDRRFKEYREPLSVVSMYFNLTGEREEGMAVMYLRLLAPVLDSYTQVERYFPARSRVHDTAIAVRLYQLEHDRWPEDLPALVPDLLAEVPGDPHNVGKPLQYRFEGRTARIYSVGPNGVDDEGRDHKDEPRGDDLCVKLVLPEE